VRGWRGHSWDHVTVRVARAAPRTRNACTVNEGIVTVIVQASKTCNDLQGRWITRSDNRRRQTCLAWIQWRKREMSVHHELTPCTAQGQQEGLRTEGTGNEWDGARTTTWYRDRQTVDNPGCLWSLTLMCSVEDVKTATVWYEEGGHTSKRIRAGCQAKIPALPSAPPPGRPSPVSVPP
jgi:hypothetical protein